MAYTNNLYVIAAICGNFWQESSVNPGIWENLTVGAPGYGLGQWTDNPPIVERRTALFNYLDSNGYSRDSGEGQLEFLIYENVWNKAGPSTVSPSTFDTLTQYLQSDSTDLTFLTLEWMYHWEGIDDDSEQTRISAANTFYNAFINDNGTRNPWYASNSYLSPLQAESNALLIMDFFTGETPPEPPHPPAPAPLPKKRKGLSPWLILYINERR